MKTPFVIASIAAGVAGTLFGTGSADIYRIMNYGQPDSRSMVVKELSYDPATNKITQQVYAQGADQVEATWAAKIIRGNAILCSGGALSTYMTEKKGQPISFNPKDWTYGRETTCTTELKLQPGDKIFATWQYQDGLSLTRSVSAELTIPES